QANPAMNLLWVGPLALTFQAFNQINASLWLHDLSQNSDFPRPLAPEAGYSGDAFFCSQIRRFLYIKQAVQSGENVGVYSVEVDKPSTNGDPPPAVAVDSSATAINGCEGDTALYMDSKGVLTLQRLNANGSPNGSKVKISPPLTERYGNGSLSPGGRYIAFQQDNGALALFRADGTAITLAVSSSNAKSSSFYWLSEQVVAIVGAVSDQTNQLAIIDLSQSKPTLKVVDSANSKSTSLLPITDKPTRF
ncbi:MAG: hypothetical protein WCS37_15500, partial [Chloroflexota bacterium]